MQQILALTEAEQEQELAHRYYNEGDVEAASWLCHIYARFTLPSYSCATAMAYLKQT